MAPAENDNSLDCQDSDPPHEISALETRDQLRRVLASRHFAKSPQAAHLLTFVVEEALSFNGSDIRSHFKEYAIGVRAFGRPDSFDPSSDNIVRVEVRRVRLKLDSYYAAEGLLDPILIDIPKGSYVPVFHRRDTSDVDLSGRTISHYELVHRRFTNRWQAVYDANCLNLQRSVTLILPTALAIEDEEKRQSLLAGTRGAAVNHPNVAAVHDVQEVDGRIVIAAAVPPGRPIGEISDAGTLSNDRALRFAHELATAIASGHGLGLFHGNLILNSVRIDDTGSPYIQPFGMSPLMDVKDSGLEGFRPPEWNEDAGSDLRSDVWSFGALVWFACYGVAPPSVAPVVPPLSPDAAGIPAKLMPVVTRCLQPAPSSRYANAVEILQDLPAAIESVPHRDDAAAAPNSGARKTIAITIMLMIALAVVLVVSYGVRRESRPVLEPRVSVLPFDNTSGDPENDPYCRAITEMFAARLAQLPGTHVVSSRSLKSKRGPVSADVLKKELRLDYALDGTLIKVEDNFRVTVRLMRVADAKYAWTSNYEGAWEQIVARMDELAGNAANTMGLTVQSQRNSPSSSPVPSPEAYEVWLKGRFAATEFWNTHLPRHYDDAERRLLRALEIHPDYVDAMADLAQLYVSSFYPPNGSQGQLFDKARKLAERAVKLDPQSGTAQAALGSVYTDIGHARMAMPHLLRAVQLSPQDPNARNYLSLAYEAMGFWESSLADREKAIDLDPLLRGIRTGGVPLLVRLGRVHEAARVANLSEAGSADWGARMAYIHLLTGEPRRAEAVLLKTRPEQPPALVSRFNALIAIARAVEGRPEIAREALRKLSNEMTRSEISVLLWALAGDKDALVNEIVRHAFIRNYRWLITNRFVRPYRQYPPFQRLVYELFEEWQQNLKDFGPSLPVPPPALPNPGEYLNSASPGM